jgi:hypothetical protein
LRGPSGAANHVSAMPLHWLAPSGDLATARRRARSSSAVHGLAGSGAASTDAGCLLTLFLFQLAIAAGALRSTEHQRRLSGRHAE